MSRLSCLSPSQSNATCSPSGEKTGWRSSPINVVSWTTRIGGAALLVGEGRRGATANQVTTAPKATSSRAPAVSSHQTPTDLVTARLLGVTATGASDATG